MSRFYFSGDDGSASSGDEEDNLPYPQALPRSDFLAPSFDAPTYLSSLSNRHQTLEDLRNELRERSQALSRELLDLVNINYEQFLTLGSDLRGGEEKIEDVRVGLLGFKRGVEDVREKIKGRGQHVQTLMTEKTQISKQISHGRKLLEFDAKLGELEEKLMVDSLGRASNSLSDGVWSDSEDDEQTASESLGTGTSLKKLRRLVSDYNLLGQISGTAGRDHPFIKAQEPRLIRIRHTLLLDINTTLKLSADYGKAESSRLLEMAGLYREMGEITEGAKALQGLRE